MSIDDIRAGWSLAVVEHGTEREPVVVIDNFAPDPQRFVDDAGHIAGAHTEGRCATGIGCAHIGL